MLVDRERRAFRRGRAILDLAREIDGHRRPPAGAMGIGHDVPGDAEEPAAKRLGIGQPASPPIARTKTAWVASSAASRVPRR